MYAPCGLRLCATDYETNIYVLNFIHYETVITINQTVPRDAEDCGAQLGAVRATRYPDGDAGTDNRRSLFDMVWAELIKPNISRRNSI